MDIEIEFNDIQHGDYIIAANHIVYKYIGYYKKIKAYIAIAIDDSECIIFDINDIDKFEKIYRRTTNDVNNKPDNVEHPSHYTSHPSGIECIEITRHYCFSIGNAIKYLWRAGLKKDASLSDKQKEIEDLNKAIWYINDRIKQLQENWED